MKVRKRRGLLGGLVALFMVISMVVTGLPAFAANGEGYLPSGEEPTSPDPTDSYTVHVMYSLEGGEWPEGQAIANYDIVKPKGENIPVSEFKGKGVVPIMEGYIFDGWGVHCFDMKNNQLGDEYSVEYWEFNDYVWRWEEDDPDEYKLVFYAYWKPDPLAEKEDPAKEKQAKEAGKVEKAKAETPKTGDNSSMGGMVLLMMAAGAAAYVVAGRKMTGNR